MEQEINLDQPLKTNKKPLRIGNPDIPLDQQPASGRSPMAPMAIPTDATPSDLVDFLINKPIDEIIPWEEIILPSKGLFYDGRIPEGKVEVRPMGIVADKILATTRLTQSGQAIDQIFRRCVKFPDGSFDPLDLLVGDRTFLLFYLRGITHGNIYEFQVHCSNEECGAFNECEYDLNNIANTIKYPKVNSEPIKIILPHLSTVVGREFWVETKLMRGRDVQHMGKKKKIADKINGNQVLDTKNKLLKRRSSEELDQTIEENLNLLITSVMGVADRNKIQQVIEKMTSRDSGVIREHIRDVSPGIDAQIVVKCVECGNEMKIDLPITESFFRPQDTAGMRE